MGSLDFRTPAGAHPSYSSAPGGEHGVPGTPALLGDVAPPAREESLRGGVENGIPRTVDFGTGADPKIVEGLQSEVRPLSLSFYM